MTLFANVCVWKHTEYGIDKAPPRSLTQGTVCHCHSLYLQPSFFSLSYFAVNPLDQRWPFLMHIFYLPLAYGRGRRKGDQLWVGVFQPHHLGTFPGMSAIQLPAQRQDSYPLSQGTVQLCSAHARTAVQLPFSLFAGRGQGAKRSCTPNTWLKQLCMDVHHCSHPPACPTGVRSVLPQVGMPSKWQCGAVGEREWKRSMRVASLLDVSQVWPCLLGS